MIMPNAAASLIAQRYQYKAGAITLANACASSAMAIGQAFQAIRSNALDVAIVGGSEAMLEPAILHAWARMRVLAKTLPAQAAQACRPFDADRNGLCLAEGAASMLLMRANWAQTLGLEPCGEIRGYGQSCDAANLVAPDTQGQLAAMRQALSDADLRAQQLGYISAHATGTPKGDACEWQALRALFHDQTLCPVASIKSALGHTMGASGAVAAVLTLAMLQQGWFAPTLHLKKSSGSETPLHALLAGMGVHLPQAEFAMVNAFGFGGSNASLILKK
jgi:3-oxoacyl-[acyl-carrier-protein] synthase II